MDAFTKPSTFCLRSAEERYGYLRTQSVTFASRQQVSTYHLTYVVWKRPGDR